MNEHARNALESTILSLDSRIKCASEALQEAKRLAHGRDSELSDLYRQREAIRKFLQEHE